MSNVSISQATTVAPQSTDLAPIARPGNTTPYSVTLGSIANLVLPIANSGLVNSTVIVNGQTIALGGSGTITAAAPYSLSAGTGLSGGPYNGSAAASLSIANTGVTAGSYGGSTSIPVVTVNAQGQVTNVTTATVGGGTVTSVQISGDGTGLTFAGGPITTAGTITLGGTLSTGSGGTGSTASPTAGAVAYGTGSAYAFTTAGAAGQLLESTGGTAPTWISPSALSVGTATNIAGGLANQIHYQTGTGTTGFITAPTTASTYLEWNGTGFVWAATSGGTVTNIVTGTGLTGGPITSAGTISIANTGVTAGIYGGSTAIPVVTVNAQGQITNVTTAAVGGGTVTSVQVSGDGTGLTFTGGPITSAGTITMGGTLGVGYGGTGLVTTPTAGQLLIGTGSGFALNTLTAGSGIGITNTAGTISIAATGTSAASIAVGSSPVTGGTSGRVLYDNAGVLDEYSITGTAGSVVMSNSPTLVTPDLGTPSSLTLTNATGLPLTTGVTGVLSTANGGTGISTTPTNGQIDIGNGTGFTRTTLTAGTNITITNSAGGISIASTNPGGTVTSIDTGTGLTGGPITSAGTISLANTGVIANSYGDASNVGTFTVNAQGQLTAAGSTAISIPASAINTTIPNSGLTNSSITINGTAVALGGSTSVGTVTNIATGTGLTGGPVTSTGTISIANTGVISGSYGGSTAIPVLTVNAQGQITNVTTAALGGGTVTSIDVSGDGTGLTFTGGPVTTSGTITLGGTLGVGYGGTGLTAIPTNGQIDIGNGTGFTRTTLTAGSNVTITNSAGGITIASSNPGGTVTSVQVSGDGTGLTFTGGPITSAGTITLGGTLGVGYGGTGLTTTATNGQLLIGTGTGYALNTLTAGSGVSITNAAGSITVSATGTGGTVTSVDVSGGSTGLTTTGGPITGAGTITLGGLLGPTYGGTGVNNGSNTLTLGGNLTTVGAFPTSMTITGPTSVVFPTTGTLATTANTVASFSAGSTGLTPATATTGAVTLGGTLATGYGGTGGTATPTAGAVAYGTGTAYAFTAAGTAGQVLQSTGAGAPTWSTPSTGSFQPAYYGTFVSTANQTNGGSTTANPVSFDTTALSNGVSITSSNRITFANAGIYIIAFELAVSNSAGSNVPVFAWLAQNGTNITNTSSQFTITGGANQPQLLEQQWIVNAAAGDYVQIYWSCSATTVSLLYTAAASSPTRPAGPSAIVNVALLPPSGSNLVVGSSTITGGTSGRVVYDNAGVVGEYSITGTAGSVVMSNSPTLTTPALGTPSALVLTNATGLPLTSGVTGVLPAANGGTGVNNGTNTLTLGGNLTTSGAFATTLTVTGATNVTLPTSGTLATTGATVASFSAGTTGLTPSTATTGAVTLAGTLSTANGGTGLTGFTANQILYASSTSAIGQSSKLTFDGTNLRANTFGLQGNISSAAWTTNGIRYANTPVTITDTSSVGTVATAYTDVFGGNTIAASSAVTYTNYYAVYLNAPTAGTNVAFTNAYALGVGGNANVTGALTLGTALSPASGGTGVNNGSNTLTMAGNVTHAGAFPVTITATGTTSVTIPTSGTLATTANTVASFSAGTTGFTPSTATTGAVTLSGTLGTANGGTNLTTFTAANNAIYSTSASALTAGTLPVAAGGSGATTLTGVLKGNGTSAFTAATAGTDYVAPGTATTFTTTQTFNGSSSTFAAVLLNAAETTTVSATAATGTINFYVNSQSILYYTTNASANFTLNFAFSSGTSMNTALATGQTVTCVFMCTNGATAYYANAFTVDGVSVTPKWQGGTAPTAGNASSIDVYQFSITKTASATYTILASQTKFA